MRRWHQDLKVTRAHWREHLTVVHDYPRKPLDCQCELQVGRFRKIGGHGCGKAHCMLCHGDKISGILTHRYRKTRLSFREQVTEFGR